MDNTFIPSRFSSVLNGIAINILVGFVGQVFIFGLAFIWLQGSSIGLYIPVVVAVALYALLFYALWKRQWYFALGLFLGSLIDIIENLPFILGT